MVIADDVISIIGYLVVPANTKVTNKVLELLNFHRILVVTIFREELKEGTRERTHLETVRESPQFKEFQEKFIDVTEELEGKINEIVYLDKEVDVKQLWNNLDSLISHTENSLVCFDLLRSMKHDSDFTYIHSVNVALISNMLAKWLKFKESDVELISVAGLLHDIGKTKLPRELLERQQLMNSQDIIEYKRHCTLGYNILKERNVERKLQLVALTHHERCDGAGYPLRIRGPEICDYARIVAIADTFDELTATHANRKNVDPFRVIQMFESEGLHQFDTEYMLTFLGSILNTYIHSTVRLSNGLKGEIIFVNKADPSRPIVKVGSQFIDLSINRTITVEAII